RHRSSHDERRRAIAAALQLENPIRPRLDFVRERRLAQRRLGADAIAGIAKALRTEGDGMAIVDGVPAESPDSLPIRLLLTPSVERAGDAQLRCRFPRGDQIAEVAPMMVVRTVERVERCTQPIARVGDLCADRLRAIVVV